MAQLLPGSLCVHGLFRCQRLVSNFSVPDIWRIIPCLIITRPTCGALGLDWCTIDLTSPVLTPLTGTSLYVNLSEENCPSHLIGLVNYSWKNAVPPIDTSLTVQFQVDRPTIFSSIHPPRYVGHHADCTWATSRVCYIGQRLDHASLLRSGPQVRSCSPRVWPKTTLDRYQKDDRFMCEKCSIS